jgi:thiol-disulfide isomerase/thioredoxin
MKKIVFLLLATFIAACSEDKPSVITGLEGKTLPSFNFLLMDSSTRINTKSIITGKPSVIFIFSPYCPYCRAQTEAIIDDIKSFSNMHFYVLSSLPFNLIKDYYDHYQLNKYPNITVGQDYDGFLGNYYKVHAVPYIAVYNRSKKLKQVLMGNVTTRVLRDIIYD